MTARELTTDLEVLDRLTQPAGKDMVDIGCGGGALVRALSDLGARVVGVEISAQQLATAVAQDNAKGARYVVGEAQHLPLEDASVDVALFMRTLHHVPVSSLVQALREARRVARPDGLVYVAEPLTEGDFFELVSLVEDEFEVRRAAQHALGEAFAAGLARTNTVEYDVQVCIRDLAMLRRRIVSVDPQRAQAFDTRRAELADAFARLGAPGAHAGERCFLQPMRADLLQPAGS